MEVAENYKHKFIQETTIPQRSIRKLNKKGSRIKIKMKVA